MTLVPLSSGVIEGLINLRGQIVTALDMRRRMYLPDRDPASAPMNIVVRTDDGAVSLLVDEIGDVVEVEESTFETPPETVRPSVRNLILGIHKLKGRLLHVLDIEKACLMVDTAEAASAR